MNNSASLLTKLNQLPYFTTQTVSQLSDSTDKSVLVMLSRLVKQKKIIRLKKGFYMGKEFYLVHQKEFYFRNLLSNIIQPASYLSREYILQNHNILTEATYPTTAVTTKNTQQTTTVLGHFDFAHIKDELYGGYKITYHHQIACAKASLGKALFDFLYLRSFPESLLREYSLQEELRLNLENLTASDWDVFEEYVTLSQSPKMNAILKNIRS